MRQWRTDTPGGFIYSSEVQIPEGLLLVTDTFAYAYGSDEVAAMHTLREATLDGEPVFYPRSARLASKAGLA